MKYHNKNLHAFSKERKSNQTYGEMLLWSKLKNREFLGLKFRRQHIIDNYIVDFFNHENNLVIEIDGTSHDERRFNKDVLREQVLKKLGFTLLRFTEFEVTNDLDSVLLSIEIALNNPSP